jgi:NMD protein affecting ribosome stability and mRNA decay
MSKICIQCGKRPALNGSLFCSKCMAENDNEFKKRGW